LDELTNTAGFGTKGARGSESRRSGVADTVNGGVPLRSLRSEQLGDGLPPRSTHCSRNDELLADMLRKGGQSQNVVDDSLSGLRPLRRSMPV